MKDPNDPKGLIRESYRIEGITAPECRSIFMDWALSVQSDDPRPLITGLLDSFGAAAPDHPMTAVLRQGMAAPQTAKRRGGRATRVPD